MKLINSIDFSRPLICVCWDIFIKAIDIDEQPPQSPFKQKKIDRDEPGRCVARGLLGSREGQG